MIAKEVVRRAALITSVMDSGSRNRLLASLDPATAEQLVFETKEVCRRGWNRRELVDLILASEEGKNSHLDSKVTDMRILAGHLDSASFSRVLAAHGSGREDFLLSLLDIDYAQEVRRHLSDMPVLPKRLHVATLAAAEEMAKCAPGGSM